MDTAQRTHRTGLTLALLLGGALAVAPLTAHATVSSETGVAPQPNLRQLIEADREAPVQGGRGERPPRNLRQLVEADRPPESFELPVVRPDGNLRQLIEADRRAAPIPDVRPNLRQLIEADRAVAPRLGVLRR